MFELARLAISAVVGAAMETVLCMPTVSAAPVAVSDGHSAELRAEAPTDSGNPGLDGSASRAPAEDSIVTRGAEMLATDLLSSPWVEGLLRSREFELSITEDEYKRHSPPAPCLNSESFLRRLAGGADDCPAFKPGADESEVFNLPFVAICGWILIVLTVAGLHRLYGIWRVRRWLRRMRALGVMPSAANPRRLHRRGARRSGSRGKSRSGRYAG
jgi:hypothetical protein